MCPRCARCWCFTPNLPVPFNSCRSLVRLPLLAFAMLACVAASRWGDAQTDPPPPKLPRVTHICLVTPDILALTVESGKIARASAKDYAPAPGDDIELRDNGQTSILKRAGKEIGELLGGDGPRQLITFWIYSGDSLKTELSDRTDIFTITSVDDPEYRSGVHPISVNRKSKPTDWMPGAPVLPARHVVFLRMPAVLKEGAAYKIDCGNLNLEKPQLTFSNDTRKTRSLAIHTSQIGYRADDPFKRGYLSIRIPASVAMRVHKRLKVA